MKAWIKYIFFLLLISSWGYCQTIINIPVGTSEAAIQQLIDNNPTAGTTFKFAPGIFRVGNLKPKTGQIFEGTLVNGNLGTTLSGARELSNYYYSPGNGFPYVYSFNPGIVVAASKYNQTDCHQSSPYCYILQDLFIAGQPLNPNQWQWETTLSSDSASLTISKIFLSVLPYGLVELGEKSCAFHGYPEFYYSYQNGINGEIACNVTIRNFVVEKYASQAQHGAIEAGLNWKIENNEVRLNHGAGIRFNGDISAPGSMSIIKNNYVHHNGQIGIVSGINEWIVNPDHTTIVNGITKLQTGMYPYSSQVVPNPGNKLHIPSRGSNSGLVESNTISYNNYAGYSSSWEAGGTKFVLTDNLKIYKNVSRDNFGPGLWTDIENINTSYEGNLSFNNKADKGDNGNGIFHEVSFLANIKCNIVYNNFQTTTQKIDIQISSSKDVYITDNKIGILKSHADFHSGEKSYFSNDTYNQNSGYHIARYNRVQPSGITGPVNQFISTSPNVEEDFAINNTFSFEKTITGNLNSSGQYFPRVKTYLTTTTFGTTHFRAWMQVLLQPGFTANPGFLAETCNCIVAENPGSSLVPNGGARIASDTESKEDELITSASQRPDSKDLAPYPNPNTGKFEVFLDQNSTNIELVDLLGRTIFSEQISTENTFTKVIDVPNANPGVYLLKIIKQNTKVIHKILITD
jgi:hypothetical protein